jgi:hypothetical protein
MEFKEPFPAANLPQAQWLKWTSCGKGKIWHFPLDKMSLERILSCQNNKLISLEE